MGWGGGGVGWSGAAHQVESVDWETALTCAAAAVLGTAGECRGEH